MTVGVLLVDDQPVVRSGLRVILGSDPGLTVVGEAADGIEALALVQRRRPDVVLMDIRMPRMDGIEATRRIAADPATAHIPVVILTTFDLDDYVFGALRAGAAGFLLKNTDADRLCDALRTVAAGHGLIAPELTRRLIAAFAAAEPEPAGTPELTSLSDREHGILRLMVAGLTNIEIAQQLILETSTIKSHVTRIFGKLGVRNRVQAVIYAYERGVR